MQKFARNFQRFAGPARTERASTICSTFWSSRWLQCCVGRRAPTDMALFARSKEKLLRQFLQLENGIPSHDTFSRVLRALDPEAFEKSLSGVHGSLRQGQRDQAYRRRCDRWQGAAGRLRARQEHHAVAYGQCLRGRSSNGSGLAQGARPQRGQRSVGSTAHAVARRLHRYRRCAALQSTVCRDSAASVAAITRWRSRKIRANCSMPSRGALPAPASAASPSDWNRPLTTATNPGAPPSFATPAWLLQTAFQGVVAVARITSRRRLHGKRADKPAVRYYLLSKYISRQATVADCAQSLGHREPAALGTRRRVRRGWQPNQKRQRSGEPRDLAKIRTQHHSLASRPHIHASKSQTRWLGRCLPSRSPQPHAIALPSGRVAPSSLQRDHASLVAPLPSAACAAASRAIGTRNGEHDT